MSDIHSENDWDTAEFSPLELTLDTQNARIDVDQNAGQAEIIDQLLQYEDITDLARSIAREGLLRGERIIVTRQSGFNVVLEGNRRTCACQLLLNRSLVPAEYRDNFPTLEPANRSRATPILADIAPSRSAAERILTLRHIEPGIRRWTPIAKMRRSARLYEAGHTIEQIAAELKSSKEKVRRSIRHHNLLELAKSTPRLNKFERAILHDPTLKVNPFVRFFELKGALDRLHLTFDSNQLPKTSLKKTEFYGLFRKVIRSLLVPDPNTGKPSHDTRANVLQILGPETTADSGSTQTDLKSDSSEGTEDKSKKDKEESTHEYVGKKKKRAKSEYFFENLICTVMDNSCISVVDEITKINPKDYPLTSTFLIRALLESSLSYMIREAGEHRHVKSGRGDPGLSDLVRFTIQNPHLLPDERAIRVLRNAKDRGELDYLNIVIHGRWAQADAEKVVSIAKLLRELIRSILSK